MLGNLDMDIEDTLYLPTLLGGAHNKLTIVRCTVSTENVLTGMTVFVITYPQDSSFSARELTVLLQGCNL